VIVRQRPGGEGGGGGHEEGAAFRKHQLPGGLYFLGSGEG